MEGVQTMTRVQLGFHEGETLLKLAGTYPTLQEVIEEAVQNCLDAGAGVISIFVDFSKRTCRIRDNGSGVSQSKFYQALNSVGKGIKTDDKLGRFGLGLIAPLGKCAKFTFISSPKPQKKGFIQWLFNTAAIQRQHKGLTIPEKVREDIIFGQGQGRVWWRTQVNISDFTPDKTLSALSLESLSRGILEKYSLAMGQIKTKVNIRIIDESGKEHRTEVVAGDFQGKPLPTVELHDTNCGRVVFRMFITRQLDRKKKRINIRFGELNSAFRFSAANFLKSSINTEWLSGDLIEAIRSGIFEGEILAEKVTLNPSRKSFEVNDALIGLYDCMYRWYEDHARQFLESEKEAREASRYQDLGLQSMNSLVQIFKSDENRETFKQFRELIKLGTIGTGHAKKSAVGTQGQKAASTEGCQGGSQPRSAGNGEAKPKPKTDHSKHWPGTVQGPRGQFRRLVKNDSLGLQFAFDDIEGSPKLWEFNTDSGTIIFNITHPLWVACDISDYKLRALMEQVSIQAIALAVMPDKTFQLQQRLCLDKQMEFFVQLLTGGGAISRSSFRKK